MTTEVIRGNDELAYWLRGMPSEFRGNGYITYFISYDQCPISASFRCNFVNDDHSFKSMYNHVYRFHDDITDTDVYKKSIAILQLLVKYEVNDGSKLRARLNKRNVAVYELGKEFGLSADILKELLHKQGVTEIMRMAYRGLVLYHTDETLPQWIKNVMNTIYNERRNMD